MLLVTNRPSVYVLLDGKTEELKVDVPTEVPDFQGAGLIKRGICLAVIKEPITSIASHYNPVLAPPVTEPAPKQKAKAKSKK